MEAPLRPQVSPRRPGPAARAAVLDSEAAWKSVELAQRGRMILDVAAADLEAAEARLGAFHETTWYFRNALAEARRSWDRLRAEYGTAALAAALAEPPRTVLAIGDPDDPAAMFVPIGGRTFRVERIPATPIAPVLWRLTALAAPVPEPYYVGRLADGTTHCDCAEWIYNQADAPVPSSCKHLAALAALGWL